MTPREEKFVEIVNSVARDLSVLTIVYTSMYAKKLHEAIKEFCGAEPTPIEKAQTAFQREIALQVAEERILDEGARENGEGDYDVSEIKDKRDDRDIARERWEDGKR